MWITDEGISWGFPTHIVTKIHNDQKKVNQRISKNILKGGQLTEHLQAFHEFKM